MTAQEINATEDRKTIRAARIARCDAAYAAAKAAHVPDEDRDGPGSEPVTVTGYYPVPTVSGRPAWALYVWANGHCREKLCTYDTALEHAATDAAVDDPRHHDDW